MKKYFLTFATTNWPNALIRMYKQTQYINYSYGYFDKTFVLDETFLDSEWRQYFDNFKNDHAYAYWSWKPYLILKILNKLDMNDMLIYADAGCSFPINNIALFLNNFDIIYQKLNDVQLNFAIGRPEDKWHHCSEKIVRTEILNYFGLFNDMFFRHNFKHYESGMLVMKKTESVISLITQWYNFFKEHYIDMIHSQFLDRTNQLPLYEHNGADQAILQCLLYKSKLSFIDLNTYWYNSNFYTRLKG